MIIKNAKVYKDGAFRPLELETANGVFCGISEATDKDGTDFSGKLIIPGLVDIHTHGCNGFDFNTATIADIGRMTACYNANGVTTVLATIMTAPKAVQRGACERLKLAAAQNSTIGGIYMEGPFLSREKKGAHDERYLIEPDCRYFSELDELSGGIIRIVAVDPCANDAETLTAHCREKRKTVALAHTACDYATAKRFFDLGATDVTHLFNAMNGLHHREPGLVGAALEGSFTAELICDLLHIHQAVLSVAFRALGKRAVIISDSMAACGMGDGEYELGGLAVSVSGKRAELSDGTIAGSVTFASTGMRNAISCGVAPEDAVFAATEAPARVAGIFDRCGSIAAAKAADFVVLNPDYSIDSCYKSGILAQ